MTQFFSWQSCHILSVTLWLAVIVAESVVRCLRVHTCRAQAVLRIYRQVLTQLSLPLMFCLSPEVEWLSSSTTSTSRKCDDQSRQRHQQNSSSVSHQEPLPLVEVNLLYNHILLSLPALIFWAVMAEDTDTHCEFTHLDILFILRLKSGSWLSLTQARGNAERPAIMCLMLYAAKTPRGEG